MKDSLGHSRGSRGTGARCVIGAVLALAGSSGCSWLADGPVEDLGSTGGGLSQPDPGKEFLEQLDPGFEGRWVGYVEDPSRRGEDGEAQPAVFPSGSTEVTLDYRIEREYFTPSATLVFGAGPAEVPREGVTYPAGVHHFYADFVSVNFDPPAVEGFEYQLSETDFRVAGFDPLHSSLLTYTQLAAFDEWCTLQVPVNTVPPAALERIEDLVPAYDCLGAQTLHGGDPLTGQPCNVWLADGTERDVDCDYATMCGSNLCSCNEDRCIFDRGGTLAQVWLERQGDEIIGTISGATLDTGRPGWYAPMGTLHLQRVGD